MRYRRDSWFRIGVRPGITQLGFRPRLYGSSLLPGVLRIRRLEAPHGARGKGQDERTAASATAATTYADSSSLERRTACRRTTVANRVPSIGSNPQRRQRVERLHGIALSIARLSGNDSVARRRGNPRTEDCPGETSQFHLRRIVLVTLMGW